jgi:hypothetical protein
MTFKRSFISETQKENERRSGLNRRWIKAPYDGQERRRGSDRRNELSQASPPEHGFYETERTESLEKLLFATSVRVEAMARLLVDKGVLSHEELSNMLNSIQAEYRPRKLKGD